MSDDADFWRDFREAKKARKKRRAKQAPRFLAELASLGYKVDRLSPYHFRVYPKTGFYIDYYPTTGRWLHHQGAQGFNFASMLELLERLIP